MKGLHYQLKSVLHDKFCLMSFLLPLVVAAALNTVGMMDFSSLGELHFGILEHDLPGQTITWLEQYGPVTAYPTQKDLEDAIKEPSTNLIGVKADGKAIRTILSGDELDLFRQTADTLPALYEQRELSRQAEICVLERPDVMAKFHEMFLVVTLIVAMFMGCTFNAMNMISEKEDGVALINEILPMTARQYALQKLAIGFVLGCLSAIFTAAICFRLPPVKAALLLALIVLSSFVSALIGLLIGRISDTLMVGVIYIKLVLLVFMAVPILSFLVGIRNPLVQSICYFVPSQATFEGIMDLANGGTATAIRDGVILAGHCAGWFLLYLLLSKRKRMHASLT